MVREGKKPTHTSEKQREGIPLPSSAPAPKFFSEVEAELEAAPTEAAEGLTGPLEGSGYWEGWELVAVPLQAEDGLLEFIPRVSPEFSSPTHLSDWVKLVEGVVEGGVRGLCEYPIRHQKTETTIHGIAWLQRRDPTMRIIYMVADHEIAKDRGTRIRQVCKAAGVLPAKGETM